MKILYVILSCEKYLKTRCIWQKKTFLLKTKYDFVFLSAQEDIKNNVLGWNTDDDYSSCPIKYLEFFKNYKSDYDWYFFIDDDTFVFENRIEQLLKKYNKNEMYYIGSILLQESILYMSGGAGFFISNSLYKLICNNIDKFKIFEYSDTTIGHLINKLILDYNISIINIEEFNQDNHLKCGLNTLNNAITYHYVNEELFYFYNLILSNNNSYINYCIISSYKNDPNLKYWIIIKKYWQKILKCECKLLYISDEFDININDDIILFKVEKTDNYKIISELVINLYPCLIDNKFILISSLNFIPLNSKCFYKINSLCMNIFKNNNILKYAHTDVWREIFKIKNENHIYMFIKNIENYLTKFDELFKILLEGIKYNNFRINTNDINLSTDLYYDINQKMLINDIRRSIINGKINSFDLNNFKFNKNYLYEIINLVY